MRRKLNSTALAVQLEVCWTVAMNVLHVFKTYLPDSFTGVERVIWNIAEGTAAYGVKSRVLYPEHQAVRRADPVGKP